MRARPVVARACTHAASGDLAALRALPRSALKELDEYGSQAIHWAASCGQVEVLSWLVEAAGEDPESVGLTSQRAKKRRPLHWAARNGQLECVQYLVESANVDPDPRDKQSVSPFQLAVWQNQGDVARYLVESAGVDVTQLNSFACGAQHWLGTTPRERAGEDGEELIPLAQWLLARGCDMHAPQRQGHRPLHKAAWGGQIALAQWLRDACGAIDDFQDHSGNYAADVADMGGHTILAKWLRDECSGARARSLATLGLPPETADPAAIRQAFFALARVRHPDQAQRARAVAALAEGSDDGAAARDGDAHDSGGARDGSEAVGTMGVDADFAAIRAAYEHLTAGGGRGHQANPTHSLHRMLQATSTSTVTDEHGSDGAPSDAHDAARFFRAQLAAVAHEYGAAGIPLPALKKKFAEVWAKPLPSAAELGLPAKTPLLKLVEHFDDAVRVVPAESGGGGAPRLVAILARSTVLGQAAEGGSDQASPAIGVAPPSEAAPDLGDDAPPASATGGGNTRVAAARWPDDELAKLAPALRPRAGETLDLILRQKVLFLQARRGYRANVDSMLLPYYAAKRAAASAGGPAGLGRVADLGCGNGLVGILCALQWPEAHVAMFERQPSLADLCARNLALSGLAPPPAWPADGAVPESTCPTGGHPQPPLRAALHVCDLSDAGAYPHAAFDGVLCNPPYFHGQTGVRPMASQKAEAHYETTLSIDGFVGAMADMLVCGGKGWLVYDTAEGGRLESALAAHAGRLVVTNRTRKVHTYADDDAGTSSRLLIEVERRDALPAAPAEAHAHDLLPLHPDGGAPDREKVYTDDIESWLAALPPPHFEIRSWDWLAKKRAE